VERGKEVKGKWKEWKEGRMKEEERGKKRGKREE